MEQESLDAASPDTASFFSLVNHPLKLKLYFLMNVPPAFFSGVKVVSADERSCTASVPFRHLTRNPFRSTYFASLSMAAELSTGVLAMANTYHRKPAVSMLLTGMEARFHKKATSTTFFTCTEGEKISSAVATAIAAKQSQQVTAFTIGKNAVGEVVAEFWFTWSFKAR